MEPKVIKENQRLCALDNHVVNVHGNAIDAYGVVDTQFAGKFHFCAHAIGACNKDGVLEIALKQAFIEVKAEHTRKTTVFSENAWAMRSLHHGLNQPNKAVASLDINACVGVR
jgi:hypothetical protein